MLLRAQMDCHPACSRVSAAPKRLLGPEIAQNLQASRVYDERSRLVGAVDQPIDIGFSLKPLSADASIQAGWVRTHHQNVPGCNFLHRNTAASSVRVTIPRASTEE